MMTKTPIGHRAASAVRPAVLAPTCGAERMRRGDVVGGAPVRRYALGAPTTSLAGTPLPVLKVLTT